MTKAFRLKMIMDILEHDCNVESVDLQDDNTIGIWFYKTDNNCYRLDDYAQDKLYEHGLDIVFNDCPGYYHEGMVCFESVCGHKVCE